MAFYSERLPSRASLPNPVSDLMKCTICIDKLDKPRVLPCLHSFCEKCLQLYMENYANDPQERNRFLVSRTFPCPSCRERTPIPPSGVKGFRHDFRVEQLDDLLKHYKSTLERERERAAREDGVELGKKKEKQASKVICEFCPEDCFPAEAVNFCSNCWRNFCRSCTLKHTALPVFKDHTFRKIQKGGATDRMTPGGVCALHSGERNDFFCTTCNIDVCVKCTMAGHQNHALSDMKSGCSNYHENARSLCLLLKKRLGQLKLMIEQLSSDEMCLKHNQRETKRKIHQKADDLIKIVRDQERRLIKELGDKAKEQVETIGAIRSEVEVSSASMQSMFDFVNEMTGGGTQTQAFVPFYTELISHMEELLENSLHLGRSNLATDIKFKNSSSKIKLGKLQLATESPNGIGRTESEPLDISTSFSSINTSFHQQMAEHFYKKLIPTVIGKEGSKWGEFHIPKDVCFTQDGNIIVADTGNDRLQVLDQQGKTTKLLCEGLVRPWGIAVHKNGTIFIADALGKCVTVVDKSGTITSRQGKFLCPCGIALTEDDNILVTDFFSTSLYCFDKTGNLSLQFDFRDKQDRHISGTSYLALSSTGNIIISDISNHCIKIFDKKGKKIARITQPTHEDLRKLSERQFKDRYNTYPSFSPQGVAVDEKDTILVVDGATHSVKINSSAGHYLSSFFDEKNWRGLSSIAVMPSGQMVALTDVISHQVILLQRPSTRAPSFRTDRVRRSSLAASF